MVRQALAAAVVVFMSGAYAQAETYPAKPIRLVVPLAPGGTTDTLARIIGQRFNDSFGWPVIVDNRPGAGGNIGNEVVARAAADGYTLLMTTPPLVINPSLMKVGYAPLSDYTPISLVASIPVVLAVHPSVPARSVKDLIALAKSNPGKYNYASSGNGGGPHLSAALFASMAGIDVIHVPYRGSGPALSDLLGGQVHMQFSGLPPLLPFIKSGKLRALGVAGARRSVTLPDVPTISQAGLPGYESASWQGLAAPAKLPKHITARIHAEIAKFIAVRENQSRLIELGAEPIGSSPEEFSVFIKAEFEKWARVIRQIGARAD